MTIITKSLIQGRDEMHRVQAVEIIRQVLVESYNVDDLHKTAVDIYYALYSEPVIGRIMVGAISRKKHDIEIIFDVLNNGVWLFTEGEDYLYKVASDIYDELTKGGSNNMATIETVKKEDIIKLAYDIINKWSNKLYIYLNEDDMHEMAMDIYNAISNGSINDSVTFATSNPVSDSPLGFGFTSKPNVKKAYEEFMNTVFFNGKGTCSKQRIPKVDHVQLNGDITTVIWADGTHTIVTKAADEEYDIQTALVYAIVKKITGNTSGSLNKYMMSLKEKIVAKRK